MNKIECEVIALSTSPSSAGAFALLLKEVYGNRRLPIIVGQCEAQAIALELEGVRPPRPLTHDLIKNLIENLGAAVVEVYINELRDNTFHAKIILEVSALTNEIDSRPSDAIALALRTNAPIFVAEKIMEEASFIPQQEKDSVSLKKPESKKEKVDTDEDGFSLKNRSKGGTKEANVAALQDQLREALEKEDYERAAKLRDAINKITNKN